MKDATQYEKKIRKLLSGPAPAGSGPDGEDPVALTIRAILAENAPGSDLDRAMEGIASEFVDFNELRAAPLKDLAETAGKDLPEIRTKAESVHQVLNALYGHQSVVQMDHLQELTKKQLRRQLGEIGLSPYAAAEVVLRVFEGHAIPVDRILVECLKFEGLVHPEADLADVQGFLERVIRQKDALQAHRKLRRFVEETAPKVAEKNRQAAEAAAEQAARAAEASAAEASKASKTSKTSSKKSSAKSSASKATAKKASKKTASKKASKKTASGSTSSRSKSAGSKKSGSTRKKTGGKNS
jgi:endonuclease III